MSHLSLSLSLFLQPPCSQDGPTTPTPSTTPPLPCSHDGPTTPAPPTAPPSPRSKILKIHSEAMAAARLTTCTAVASISSLSDRAAHADSSFRFPFFSSSPSNSPSPSDPTSDSKTEQPPPDEPNKSGFDLESLERGAKALLEINSSPYSKQIIFMCCNSALEMHERKKSK